MAVAPLDLPVNATAAPAQSWRRQDTALYALWALFWLLMIVIAVQDHIHDPRMNLWKPVLWESSSGLMATFWLVLQRRTERRYAQYLDRPLLWFAHHLKWLPLIAVTFIVCVYALRHGIYALFGARYEHESGPFLFAYESIKLVLFFSLWLSVGARGPSTSSCWASR
jgi:two-component system, LytTR family, sensor kinase